jgi:hypothetical protein
MPIDININADSSKAQHELRKFKSLALNIARDVSGAGGQIVGTLGKIPGVAGIAAGAIASLGGAFYSMASKTAAVTKNASQESMDFLISIENLKAGFNELVVSVGNKVIPVFNDLFDVFGLGTKSAEGYYMALMNVVRASSEEIENLKLRGAIQSDPALVIGLQNQLKLVRDLIDAGADRATIDQAIAVAQKFQDEITGKAIEENRKKREEAAKEELRLIDEINRKKQQLNEDVQRAIKEEKEAQREALLEGLDAAERALQKERDDFEDEIKRKSMVLNQQAENRKTEEQKISQEIQRQAMLFDQIASSAFQIVQRSQNWFDILSGIAQTVLRIFFMTKGAPIPGFGGFGANGMIAMQHGSIVNRPTAAIIGEAGPEAVVPLSKNKSRQRQEIMQVAGLANAQTTNITLNFPNARKVDAVELRNKLFPAINRELRRGSKMLSSGTV